MTRRLAILLLFAGFILAACSGQFAGGVLRGPTPMPGAAQTPLAEAEVLFTLNPPPDTPADATLSLEIVDPVTGVGFHGQRFPMDRLETGQWEASLTLPVGSLIRYRYWQTSPNEFVEHNLQGEAIRYRLAHVASSMQFVDQVASWSPSGQTENSGRIIGRLLEAGSQQPIPEMIVSAAGRHSFTDGQGRFRLEGIPVGLNNLVAYHPEGAYRVVQQGAIVAAGGTTPANFQAEPAKQVTMTFQVTLPEGTPAEPPLRMVGNLYSLGDLFISLPGGVEISAVRAPELVSVDETNYLLLASMYAGTDLRYKYTLGDGLWNAERTSEGAFRTRQLIVPETDAIQADVVESWQESGQPIELMLTTAAPIPEGEQIGLQFNPFSPFEPLPAVSDGEGRWRFHLFSPLSFGQSVSFNLCRNMECGRAQSVETFNLQMESGATVESTVEDWQWWSGEATQPQIQTNDISRREEMQVGVDLLPEYKPSWVAFDTHILQQVELIGANTITVSPNWIADDHNGTPLISFDPGQDRFQQDWLEFAQAARTRELDINLRPELTTRAGSLDQWWRQGARDNAWWTTANEQIRAYLLTQAGLAERMQAERLILNGSQLGPALPGGQLSDGTPANQPLAAETYWRALIDELQAEFSGELIFELELHEDLSQPPAFLGDFDGVHIYWHAPLAEAADPTVGAMQTEAQRYIELEILPALPADMPIAISLEYLSIENSAAACSPEPSGACRSNASFDAGAVVDDSVQVDLNAQSEALEAILLEVEQQERISGVYLRRYYPLAAMQDKSASIHGKPAEELVRYWFNSWVP